MTSLKVLA